jgi:hypothetical protein
MERVGIGLVVERCMFCGGHIVFPAHHFVILLVVGAWPYFCCTVCYRYSVRPECRGDWHWSGTAAERLLLEQ